MSGWLAFANMGAEMIGRRHQDYFNRRAATEAFERQQYQFNREVELANTAHQREVADLRAAGLNPILSGKFGGSPVPHGGSVPQASGVSGGSSVDFAGSSAKGASEEAVKSQKLLYDQQITLAGEQATAARYAGLRDQAQAAATLATVPNINADTANKLLQAPLIKAQTEQTHATAKQAEATTEKLHVEKDALVEQLKGLKVEGRIDETTYGEIMRLLGRVLPWKSR